jgi:translation initiation factor 1 (eIF-1/SUI1)
MFEYQSTHEDSDSDSDSENISPNAIEDNDISFLNNFEEKKIIVKDEKDIIVKLKRTGKRFETYIINWKETDSSKLAAHMNLKEETFKTLKKKLGCSGKINKIIDHKGEDTEVVMIQGKHVDDVIAHLKSLGINNIKKDEVMS